MTPHYLSLPNKTTRFPDSSGSSILIKIEHGEKIKEAQPKFFRLMPSKQACKFHGDVFPHPGRTIEDIIEKLSNVVQPTKVGDVEGPHPDVAQRQPRICWIIFAKEKCPKTGALHIQYACHTTHPMTFKAMKRIMFDPMNINASTMGETENRAYVMKTRKANPTHPDPKKRRYEDDVPNTEVWEFGIPHRPGTRNDLQAIGELLVAGTTPREIARLHPAHYIRFPFGIERAYATLHDVPRSDETPKNVIVHYGATGTGKTRTAIANAKRDFGPGNYYIKSAGMGDWWDGYFGHRCVIIDEFRSSFKIDFLLQLLDRNECRVQVKGGSRQFVADTIYITTPTHPDEWYPNAGTDEVKAQIKRRITEIIEFSTTV